MASSGAHKEDLPADSVGPPAPGPRSWRPIELSPLTCWAQTALAPACSPAARHGRCSRCRTLWGTEHIILTHCRGRCNSVMGAFWLSYLLRASLLLVKHFTSKAEMALAASGISVLWCHSKRFLSSLISNTSHQASHQALTTSSTPQLLNAYCIENIGHLFNLCSWQEGHKRWVQLTIPASLHQFILIPRSLELPSCC